LSVKRERPAASAAPGGFAARLGRQGSINPFGRGRRGCHSAVKSNQMALSLPWLRSSRLLARAHDQAQHTRVPVHLLEGSAESIPLADHSMDTVVMTWTGCSIPDICAALREMRRVLSFGGRLLFVEHGRAPEPGVARWQERLDPLWLRFSGGCHLSRKIDDLLADAGFRIERLRTGYIPGPRIMTFLYEGVARFR
jgi:SAM-dependent methyltransferase